MKAISLWQPWASLPDDGRWTQQSMAALLAQQTGAAPQFAGLLGGGPIQQPGSLSSPGLIGRGLGLLGL